MSSVSVTITGVLWDHALKAGRPVTLVGDAYLSDVGVGGGPVIPPGQPPVQEPPGVPTFPIWGPPGSNFPDKPGYPPVAGWPTPPGWGGPIEPPPTGAQIPPPGSPPVVIGGTQPVQPIVPPPAIVVDYPGVGKVLVPRPLPPPPS